MNDRRHLTWESFRRTYLESGAPVQIVIPGVPELVLAVQPGGDGLSLRAPLSTSEPVPTSPFRELVLRRILLDEASWLEVATTNADLFREFFFLSLSIADLVQEEGRPVVTAVLHAMHSWKRLIREVSGLSEQQELGLLGELLTLELLIGRLGEAGLRAWTGPRGEPHDFRFAAREFEVKSTVAVDRVHVITSLDQMEPSPAHDLHLVSWHLEPAGADDGGLSLDSQVQRIRELVGAIPAGAARLDDLLGRAGFSGDSARPWRRFRKRAPTTVIPVDDRCPRLRREDIRKSGQLAIRISDVQYRIDLTGLGFAEGTGDFEAILFGHRP